MKNSAPHRVSIVIPVYRGEKSLPTLIEEITPLTLGQFTPGGIHYVVCETILVHDCGPDRSDMVLEELGTNIHLFTLFGCLEITGSTLQPWQAWQVHRRLGRNN